MVNTQVLWINDLSGSINQATAPHLLANNQFKLLVNANQTEVGAIGHRLGTDKYLNLVAGAGAVLGLGMYEKSDGNRYLHMVEGGNLRVANESGETWDSQEASVWASTSTVDMAVFLDRNYMIGSGATEYLRYATESGSSSAVSGDIAGQFIDANDTYLMVVDPTTRKAQYSAVADDTFAADDYFNINGYATGVSSFGVGRPFIVYTNNSYTVLDVANSFASEVRGFGCVSNRSIQSVRGSQIYLGRDGFYMLSLNDAYPTEISRLIRNELTKDALFNQINGDNWEATASGVIDNRYFCAVKNLSGTVKGVTLNDCVIEYDLAQQTVKCHTFTDGGIGSIMAPFIDTNGDLDLYAGSNDNKAIYKMFVTDKYTDDDSAGTVAETTVKIITKDHAFFDANKQVVSTQVIESLHFRYYAANAVTIKYSIDGKNTYTELDATLPATDSDYAWEWAEVAMAGQEGKTISIDISTTGKFVLYGVGYQINPRNNTGITLL